MRSGISYPSCYALVSGGKDSLTTAQVLHEAGKLAGCVALGTGISTPDWREFIETVCADRGWPLEVFSVPNDTFDDWVRKYGFPASSKHSWIMQQLKGRAIRQFRAAHPDGILASGVRASESIVRAGSVKPVGSWEGAPILAPIYDWTTKETWDYFYDRGFERAPAYSTLQISGDCLCGANASPGEPDALRFHYPAIAGRFDDLGSEIKYAHPKRCKWGWGCERPKKAMNAAQINDLRRMLTD